MGACCTKDPREGHSESKDANFENKLVIERTGKHFNNENNTDSPDDILFKKKALEIHSNRQDINVTNISLTKKGNSIKIRAV